MNIIDSLAAIHPQENILVFFPGNADGCASACLVSQYLQDIGANYTLHTPENGDPRLDETIFDLAKHYDRIIFLDVPDKPADILTKLAEKVQIIFVDHHPDETPWTVETIDYYNPTNEGKNAPVSYILYEAINELGDYSHLCWVALLGIVGDKEESNYIQFAEDTFERYPNIRGGSKHGDFSVIRYFVGIIACGRAYYKGKGALLAATVLNRAAQEKSPDLLLWGTEDANDLYSCRRNTNRVVRHLVNLHEERAEKFEDIKTLFFHIESPLYIHNYISGILRSQYPGWIVAVANTAIDNVYSLVEFRISERNVDLLKLSQKITDGLDKSTWGGHPEAAGCRVKHEDLTALKDNIVVILSKDPPLRGGSP